MKHVLKIFITIASLIGSVAAYAAAPSSPTTRIKVERPDMDQIKAEVNNPSSRYYYPRLMRQYEQNETIMTVDDYRYLYLGNVFQEDYNPYRHSIFDTKIEELYYKQNHTRAELDSIISYANIALADDPFDLQQINFLIYALRGRGKTHLASIWQYRLNHLILAILSTGTGLDAENAWVVTDPKHEYNIINFMNSVACEADFRPPYYDFIRIEAPEGTTPEGYYFNVHYILSEYYRKHPEQLRD